MKFDVVTIGDAFEDVFVSPTGLKVKPDNSYHSGISVSFELGDKIPLSGVDYEIGGSACNTAVGFRRLGLKSSLISILGDDTPAKKIIQRMEKEGVNTSTVKVDKKMKTNFSVVFRFEQGRTIFIYHGLKDYSDLRIPKKIKTDWIFLGPTGDKVDNLQSDTISMVAESGCKLAWNPGSIQIQKSVSRYRNLLKSVSVILLNKEEIIKFLNLPVRPQEEQAIKRLYALGPKLVVVTSGKNGAKAYDGTRIYSIGAFDKTTRIDSTGAGDSFAAGFLSSLIDSDWSRGEVNESLIKDSLRRGVVNSNSVIQYVGAQKGLLNSHKMTKKMEMALRLPIRVS